MKRLFCVLLALCLLCGLPVPAAAGDRLSSVGLLSTNDRLSLVFRERGGEVRLTLEGLESQAYALQVELALEGDCPDAAFTTGLRDVYCPDCHVEAGRNETSVTIYLVSEGGSLSGKSLALGTLIPGGRFQLPSRADLLLLDRTGRPLYDGRVPLAENEDGFDGFEELGPIHIVQAEHGTVTVQSTGVKEGDTVVLIVSPDAGYVLESISVKDSRGGEIPLAADSLNRRTFRMPALEVEVTASFTPGGGLAFTDVLPGDWCYDAVRRVFEAGLMNGTSATTFTPNSPTTRGQIVAILYRLEGSPFAGVSQFSDVAPEAYYASAVSWASANGIVNGYEDNTFRPNNLITREQMAAFLYRYASAKGRNVSDRADLGVFTDAGQIAAYAVEPLRWATAAGLINGVSASTLSPGGNATRAQAAVILSRFIQHIY